MPSVANPQGVIIEDDATYNSSDVDHDNPDAEFQHIGQKSIAAMLQAPFSRAKSKVWVKELSQGGNWHERYACWLWFNRLTAFREQLLMKPKNTVPLVEDICRFIVHFASTRSGRGKGGIINYETVRHGLLYLNKTLVFKYKAWHLDAHDTARLQATMDKLLREGQLTREMTRSREPAGALVVRRLVRALYHDAIVEGTPSWSMLLNDIAIIVLTSCFSCRGGDLLGDSMKDKDKRPDFPGLRYSDLEFVVGNGGTIDDIKSRLKMRNAKGLKDDEKLFYYLFRNALPDAADNILCPVKMVLILALRSGNIQGTSVDEALNIAKARSDRMIQWIHPDRPVLCAAASTTNTPDYDRLGPRTRGNKILNKANQILGNTRCITMHALRFGSAADVMALGPGLKTGFSLDTVANELAHTAAGRSKGIGLIYAQSYSTEDAWQHRVKLGPESHPFSKLVVATDDRVLQSQQQNGTSLKRKREPTDFDRGNVARDLDRTTNTNRQFDNGFVPNSPGPAINPLRTGRRSSNRNPVEPTIDEPLVSQRYGHSEEPPRFDATSLEGQSAPSSSAQETLSALRTQLGAGQDLQARETLLQLLAHIDNRIQPAALSELDLIPTGHQVGKTSFLDLASDTDDECTGGYAENEADQDGEFLTDHALCLTDIGQNGEISDEGHGEAITALLGEDMAPTEPGSANWDRLSSILTGDKMGFVRAMASLNVVRTSKAGSKQWKIAEAAGVDPTTALAPVTRFLLPCPNARNGCGYEATDQDILKLHMYNCKHTVPVSPVKETNERDGTSGKKAKAAWMCKAEACGKSYNTKGSLTQHEVDYHDSIQCYLPGCQDRTKYLGERALFKEHIVVSHPAAGAPHPRLMDQYVATFKCPVSGCTSNATFKFYSSRSWSCPSLARHLQASHGINDAAVKKSLIPHFPGNPCSFPGCTADELFPANEKGKANYDAHLMLTHNVLDASDRYEYSWERVRAQAMPLKRR